MDDITQLIKDYEPYIRTIAGRATSTNYEDVVQEGRIAAWRAYESHDPERGPLDYWIKFKIKGEILSRVTKHYWTGQPKNTSRKVDHEVSVRTLPENWSEAGLQEPSTTDELTDWHFIEGLLSELDADEKRLVGFVAADWMIKEIAEEYSVTPLTVRNRLKKIRRKVST